MPRDIFDNSRVRLSGLAGAKTFIPLTAHIDFGDNSADRIPELQGPGQAKTAIPVV